ncbi:MAG: response regulator transcription factor [Lapillicoccus sp.]
MTALTVLICDDHTGFRASLSALLTVDAEINVIGQASDGAAAEESALRLQPDVVLMDLTMPGMGGIEATRRIVTNAPHIGVLVLTMVEDDDSVFAAMRAGARGYLLKGARRAEIVRAVRTVASGEAVFGGAIALRLIRYFDATRPSLHPAAFPQLTARELEILSLMATHLPNPSIADRLAIREKTVRNNVSAILVKLRVADRAQAILAAREAGLGSDPATPTSDHLRP